MDWISWMCLRSFTRYSGVTVHLYSYDQDLNPDIRGCVCHDGNEVLPREIFEQIRSGIEETYGGGTGYTEGADVFRYKLLYERGGWYFDTDCLLLKPLTPLFDRDYVFGRGTVSANPGVLKFPKGDILLDQLYKECLRRSPLACFPGTVPLFNLYLKKFNLTGQILPRHYFNPISNLGYQQTIAQEEGSYILHLYTNRRVTFDQDRIIKSLETEIATLNKSLGLRIARKIPFGKEIRNVLTKDKQEPTMHTKILTPTRPQLGPTSPTNLTSNQSSAQLIAGLRDFTAHWERYVDEDRAWRIPGSELERAVLEQTKSSARILSEYLRKSVAAHESPELNKDDLKLLATTLETFGNWKQASTSTVEFASMEKTGRTAFELANKLIPAL